MFESKYGKVLTIGLIILIIIVIGVLIYFTVDYIKSTNINNEASSEVDRFEEDLNKQNREENNTNSNVNEQENISNIEFNIQVDNTTSNENTNTNTTNTYKGHTVAGTIEIPKINLKYLVLKDSSKDAIEVSVAINAGPGLNKEGNTVIIGHNYRNGTFFSNNKNLSNGDKIYITDEVGTKLEYTIYNIYTTTPEDSDYMDRETNGKKEITLVTCTDDTKSRLIICAKAD